MPGLGWSRNMLSTAMPKMIQRATICSVVRRRPCGARREGTLVEEEAIMPQRSRPFIGTATGFAVLLSVVVGVSAVPHPAAAGGGAAFIGGMVAGHVVGGFVRRDRMRTEAAVHQAYGQPTYSQPAPAPAVSTTQSSSVSVEPKLNTLDKLAAGGYITKEEYQRRRRAILDSL